MPRGCPTASLASAIEAERLEIVFDTGDGRQACVNFRSRPVGLDVTRDLPMRVAGVRGHAKDLGVQPGWEIRRLAGMEVCGASDHKFQEVFRIFAGKAALLPPEQGIGDVAREAQGLGDAVEEAQPIAAPAATVVGELAERRTARATWARGEGKELEATYSALRRSLRDKLAQKRVIHGPLTPGRGGSRTPPPHAGGTDYERTRMEAAEGERLAARAGEKLLRAFDEWYRKQEVQP